VPRKITLDGHVPSRRALWLLRREHPCWRNVLVRTNRYLNNIVEQDHRAIKRRCASMLGLKSFKTAAITFAGIELAGRIRKQQFSFGRGRPCRDASLKELWDRALAEPLSLESPPQEFPPTRPRMHQNSNASIRPKACLGAAKPLRHSRKIFNGRGLYLLVMPNGGRYWRYNYRFKGKHKTIALGIDPDISLDKARARHQAARTMLANGVDPSVHKRALGKDAFAAQPS
jgi:hypothetical protein